MSKAEVSLIYQVIPFIDMFTELFTSTIVNPKLHSSIRHAAKLALVVLNKYYSYTDQSEVYRISLSKCIIISAKRSELSISFASEIQDLLL